MLGDGCAQARKPRAACDALEARRRAVSQLPQLRASFMDAAERRAGAPARVARGRRQPLRMVVAVALVLLLLAAAALAASGVLRTGSPVRPSRRLAPTVGLGAPAPGGSRVLRVS